MAGWTDFGNIWNTFKEIDIRPIADEAERPLTLAFVGAPGVGKSTLIAAMRHDAREREKMISPTIESDLENAAQLDADLIVLVVDAQARNLSDEAALCRALNEAGRSILIFYNKMDAIPNGNAIAMTVTSWCDAKITYGSAIDPDTLAADFVPRVHELLRERQLALARRYPIFRMAVARALINDTSSASATYALSTGLAEIVPALNIPFNLADIVVLTKNQALMVYKLGLAFGLSTRWQDHLAKFGGVIGAGFLWRQIARELIGLIPGWGIVPKVAIAYAGTYAVGEAILRWYRTGGKVSSQGMKEIYADALARGKRIAQDLIARAPKVSLPALPRPAMPTRNVVCANCSRTNPRGARFCAYCGMSL